MEKKENTQHHYYRTIYRYENLLRTIWYGFVFMLAHWPSLMVHVFTRKNMGERYYTLAASLTFFIILSAPFIFKKEMYYLDDLSNFFNWFSILFLLAFLYFSIKRRLEFERHSHEFDPEKFSKYKGDRVVYKWAEDKFAKNNTILKIIKSQFIYKNFESLLFIIVGLLFFIFPFSRLVGLLCLVSGLLDLEKTHVQYAQGRHYVLDQYDNLIVSREFKEAFVDNKDPKDSKYLDLAHLPRSKNRQINERLADMINAQSIRPDTNQSDSKS